MPYLDVSSGTLYPTLRHASVSLGMPSSHIKSAMGDPWTSRFIWWTSSRPMPGYLMRILEARMAAETLLTMRRLSDLHRSS